MDPNDTKRPNKPPHLTRNDHSDHDDDWQDEDFLESAPSYNLDPLAEPSPEPKRPNPKRPRSKDDDLDLLAIKPPPTRARLTLMIVVICVAAWYVYDQRKEIVYWLGSSEPMQLGNALDLPSVPCEEGIPCVPALEAIPTGTYVRVAGLQMNVVPATEKEFGTKGATKLFYQLQGSPLFVEEDAETFIARHEALKGEGTIDDPTLVEFIDIEGRFINMRDDAERRYQQMRKYYTDFFIDIGHFCVDLQPTTLKRLRDERPQGGLIASITDDATRLNQVGSGTTSMLQRLHLSESGVGYAVGSASTILKTSDSGTTWRTLSSGLAASKSLRDVAFTSDDQHGFVVGEQGTLLQTEDGGLRFTRVPGLELDHHFNAIDIHPDDKNILVAGSEGLILQSTNAGQTWTPRPIVKWPDLKDIVRTPAGTLVAVGEQGALLRSADEGKTWTWMATETVADLEDVAFDPVSGVLLAAGEKGAVLRSDDDGQTWIAGRLHKVPGIPAEETRYDRHRHFTLADFRAAALHPDGKQVLFVGEQGALGLSRDGAKTVELRSDAYATKPYLEHLKDGRGLLKGLVALVGQQTLGHLNAVAWTSDTSAMAVGQFGACLNTADAGLTWQPCHLPLEKFAALVVVKEIARGQSMPAILATLSTQNVQPNLNAVVFHPDGQGWVAGEYGLLLHTRDHGKTWDAKRPTSRHIFRLQTVAGGGLVLFSGNNGLWGYIDARTGEPTYLDQATKDTAPRARDSLHYRGVALLHPLGMPQAPTTPDWVVPEAELSPVLVGKDLLIAGYDRTKAEHWLRHQPSVTQPRALAVGQRHTPMTPEIMALTSTPRTVALAVGDEGRMLRSEDGGRSFIHTPSGTRAHLLSVTMSDDSATAFAGGEGGTLLRGSLLMRRWRAVVVPDAMKAARLSALLLDPADAKRLLVAADATLWLTEDVGTAEGEGEGKAEAAGVNFQMVYQASQPLQALAIDAESGAVMAVGNGGVVALSTDRGKTWSERAKPSSAALTGVWLWKDVALVSTQAGEIWRSADRGQTWTQAQGGIGVGLRGLVLDQKTQIAWAAAADGRRLRSGDGGVTWQVLPPLTNTALNALAYSAQTGEVWLLGADQTIFHSEISDPNASDLEGADGEKEKKAYDPSAERWSLRPVVHVWRWTSEWGRFIAELPTDLFDVKFTANQQDAFAVGSDGVILYSADGGARWITRRAGEMGEALRAVEFDAVGKIGLAVGLGSRLLWTENRGESWFSEPNPPDTAADFLAAVATGKPPMTQFTVFGTQGALARLRAPRASTAPQLSMIPNLEALRGAAVQADGVSLLAVGGDRPPSQDLCSPGYLIVAGDTPQNYASRHWGDLLILILVGGFGLFTAINFGFQVQRFRRAQARKQSI